MSSQSHPAKNNACPLCDATVKPDTAVLFGEIDCPECAKRLWYLTLADSARCFEYDSSGDLQQQAIDIIAERYELDPGKLAADATMLNGVETDSLAALELIMDLEDELGLV